LNTGSTLCQECNHGFYYVQSQTATACIPCSPGFFSDSITGKAQCQICQEGKVSYTGFSSCDYCVAGFYPLSSSECKACPPGQFLNDNQSTCAACPIAKFNPVIGSSSCIDCPPFSTSIGSASNIFDCFCSSGYYGKIESSESRCALCPQVEGMSCPTNASIPSVSPGYFRDPENILNAFPCIPSDACSMTIGEVTICSNLYTGYICGECVPLVSYRKGTVCSACPSNTSKVLTILGLLALVIFASWRLSRNLNQIPIDIRMCFSAIQMIALFPGFFSSWPENLNSFFYAISFTVRSKEAYSFSKYFILEFQHRDILP
jgi:hypothetical protein